MKSDRFEHKAAGRLFADFLFSLDFHSFNSCLPDSNALIQGQLAKSIKAIRSAQQRFIFRTPRQVWHRESDFQNDERDARCDRENRSHLKP